MITDLPTDAYLSAITVTNFLRVLPTRWRQKSTGIDMEQNYVTVTLCIGYISCARRPAALRTRCTNRLDTENNVGARNVRRSEWMSDVLSSAGPRTHTHTRTRTVTGATSFTAVMICIYSVTARYASAHGQRSTLSNFNSTVDAVKLKPQCVFSVHVVIRTGYWLFWKLKMATDGG